MDTRRKNSRIILVIIFILGFIIFTQRDAFGPDAGNNEIGASETDVTEQQSP